MSALPDRERDIETPAIHMLPHPPAQLTAGTRIVDRYRVEAVIGRGGMATVYRGHDERLKRDVAIKVCETSPARPEPPLHEEQVSSRLIHPNIVSIFDAGRIPDGLPGGGSTFIVMEYVHGTTAHDIAPVAWRQAIDIVGQVAAGLSAAHERGFVHCDVTPGNVLIDDNGRVLLADFGVAVEADSAAEDFVHGSPSYLAPERVEGARADARVDVYGLGGVFAYLLTGKHPQSDEPLELPLSCPEAVKDIIHKARARDPQARYANAREFDLALAEAPDLITDGDGNGLHLTADAITRHVPVVREEYPLPGERPLTGTQVHSGESATAEVKDASPVEYADVAPEADPSRSTRWAVYRVRAVAAMLVATVLLALLFLDATQTGSDPALVGPPIFTGSITMPDVSGMMFADAIEHLNEQGIVVSRVDVIYGPGQLNEVIAQEPPAGQEMGESQPVTLVVRTGR